MSTIPIRRQAATLLPDSARVILRPFIPADASHITAIIGRTLALTEEEIEQEVESVHAGFDSRHPDIEAPMMEHCAKVVPHVFTQRPFSAPRQFLLGAMFSGEYALESEALFNPSLVPLLDQSDVPEGCVRFIMSLWATGEGHISSIEFREGTISRDGDISLAPLARFPAEADVVPNPSYRGMSLIIQLHEMGFDNESATAVMDQLSDQFGLCLRDRDVAFASEPRTKLKLSNRTPQKEPLADTVLHGAIFEHLNTWGRNSLSDTVLSQR